MSELATLLTVREDVPVVLLMEYFEEEVIVVNEKELEDWNCHETELTAGLALTEHVITMSFPVMAL